MTGVSFPCGTWVVHVRDPAWSALELGATRTLSNGSIGGNYHPIPRELPGIVLGPLVATSSKRTKAGGLLRVLWMGRVFICGHEDIRRC